ncbi:starch synthase [Azotobacter beijerinckii]|uniref:Glycogen synthase n=2 Tax=Azotobacter beijerinckii TaxID=170623 RepID=A0A1I4CYM8_9GAMM|nr:starch synthase [Azotobacter beijerinckii]SFK85883.1 starch synthase [Azotobacter beijerinckii]
MSNASAQAQRVERLDQGMLAGTNRPGPQIRTVQENDSKKKILFVTSELSDLIKTGGLGDVSAALPRALRNHHDVRVLLPGYRQVMQSGHPIRLLVGTLAGHAALPPCRIGRIDLDDGLIVYVLISPELYERDGGPYGDNCNQDWPDNHIRFARLGLAAAGDASISWRPDLIHAHDWPAGLAPAYLRWRGQGTPSVFTIHNLAYQGLWRSECCAELAIPAEACRMERMEFHGQLSFLKAGVAYADRITTVSATYAREITTPDFGCGLEGFLRKKADHGLLSGIPNGIDESWEPETDPHLLRNFGVNDWAGKALHAEHVRRQFALEPSSGPLFVVVSRLVQQKGLDLTHALAESLVEHGGQLAVLGRGEPQVEDSMRQLAERFPGHVGANIGFDETVARRMFAGGDFLLMPSRYEPCGLSQLYAQRFGSLPIARRTGGLADTIEDGVTGFLFEEASLESYREALLRAFRVFAAPSLFHAMRCRAMAVPCFWRQTIDPYLHLYRQLLVESRHGEA